MKSYRWTQINHRHNGWGHGYRYFVTWDRMGLYNVGLGAFRDWLAEQYGPSRIEIQGPLTAEEMANVRNQLWHLGRYRNPVWDIDIYKRRIYVTEEALAWARLSGKCD